MLPRSQTPPAHGRPPGSTEIGVGPVTEVPVREEVAVGRNCRPIVQVVPGWIEMPTQVSPSTKSPPLVPPRRKPLKNKGAVPVSVTVIVWAALVVPTATGPNAADSDVKVATGVVVGGGGVPPPPPP